MPGRFPPLGPFTGPSTRIVAIVLACVVCGLIWAAAIDGIARHFGSAS